MHHLPRAIGGDDRVGGVTDIAALAGTQYLEHWFADQALDITARGTGDAVCRGF